MSLRPTTERYGTVRSPGDTRAVLGSTGTSSTVRYRNPPFLARLAAPVSPPALPSAYHNIRFFSVSFSFLLRPSFIHSFFPPPLTRASVPGVVSLLLSLLSPLSFLSLLPSVSGDFARHGQRQWELRLPCRRCDCHSPALPGRRSRLVLPRGSQCLEGHLDLVPGCRHLRSE